MKIAWKLLLVVLLLLALLAAGGLVWARGRTAGLLGRTIETHAVDFPVPFPLDSVEVASAGLSPVEADALARERAIDRTPSATGATKTSPRPCWKTVDPTARRYWSPCP